MIPLNELHPFPNHPFHVRRDADMDHLVESIRENGDVKPGEAKDKIAQHFGESASKIMRTIWLTCLNHPLLDMVYIEKMKLSLGIQINYLDAEVQCWITNHHADAGFRPTTAQVNVLRTLCE